MSVFRLVRCRCLLIYLSEHLCTKVYGFYIVSSGAVLFCLGLCFRCLGNEPHANVCGVFGEALHIVNFGKFKG